MNVVNFFENKLPAIAVSINGIQQNISESTIEIEVYPTIPFIGSFIIFNIGGGTLEGSIFCDNNIIFEVNNFKGNNVTINYNINISIASQETINTEAIISSNGGEYTIKFVIKVKPPTIFFHDFPINSLKSFFEFWKTQPTLAKKIFIKHDFYLWLYAINYEYIDIYEQFRNDPNKERGISNFFVFNKLKDPPRLSLVSQVITYNINPYIQDKYNGTITINRQGDGFIDEGIKYNAPWLTFTKHNITTSDFKNSNSINLEYIIDRNLLQKRVQHCFITLTSGSGRVTIKTSIKNFLELKLNGNYLSTRGAFSLYAKNNTNEPISIEVEALDNFIKFEKSVYIINNEMHIPFEIRLSTLQLAQKSIRRRPVFTSIIRVKSKYRDKKFFQDIKLIVGDFK